MLRFLCVLPVMSFATSAFAGVVEDIAALKKNPDRATWDRIVAAGPEAILPIIRAWPKDDPVAGNWLRTAFDHIAKANEHKLPIDDLRTYATDETAPGRPRRMALSALERSRPGTTAKLLANWLNDPEFGSDAVEFYVAKAEKLNDAEKRKLLKETFENCADYELSQSLAKKLVTLGEPIDLSKQLGFVRDWYLVGPFPVSPEDGLVKSFPPETKIDFAEKFPGKTGSMGWQTFAADPADGRVDLAKAKLNLEDGSVAYAVSRIQLSKAMKAELRLSVVDNITAWVNGKKVIERSNDYRSLYRQDRYRATLELPAGESTLLLKLTKTRPDEGQQGAATRAGRPGGLSAKWDFQARLLNTHGTGLPFTTETKK